MHITCIEGYDPRKKFFFYIEGYDPSIKYFYLFFLVPLVANIVPEPKYITYQYTTIRFSYSRVIHCYHFNIFFFVAKY